MGTGVSRIIYTTVTTTNKKMNIQANIETITPEDAQEYLRNNTNNRSLNARHIERLARDIKDGNWIVNGDAIRFNGSKLLDGQHRLSAIIKAGSPISTLVVRGLEPDAMKTIDTGKTRTLSNVLKIDGVKNATTLASAARWLNAYLVGNIREGNITHCEGLRIVEEHSDLAESVAIIRALVKGTSIMSSSVLAACHYIFSQLDPALADEYAQGLIKGTDLEEGNPVYVLRQKYVKSKMDKMRIHSADQFGLCISAWNHLRANKKIRSLKMPTTYVGVVAK